MPNSKWKRKIETLMTNLAHQSLYSIYFAYDTDITCYKHVHDSIRTASIISCNLLRKAGLISGQHHHELWLCRLGYLNPPCMGESLRVEIEVEIWKEPTPGLAGIPGATCACWGTVNTWNSGLTKSFWIRCRFNLMKVVKPTKLSKPPSVETICVFASYWPTTTQKHSTSRTIIASMELFRTCRNPSSSWPGDSTPSYCNKCGKFDDTMSLCLSLEQCRTRIHWKIVAICPAARKGLSQNGCFLKKIFVLGFRKRKLHPFAPWTSRIAPRSPLEKCHLDSLGAIGTVHRNAKNIFWTDVLCSFCKICCKT